MAFGFGYCCCGLPACGKAYFGPGTTNDLSKLEYSPADTEPHWHYTSIWGSVGDGSPYENNIWTPGSSADPRDTPASSFRLLTKSRERRNNQDFRISGQVLPLFDSVANARIDAGRVGIYVARGFVYWADFADQKLRWAPCDEWGTIPDDGEVVKDLGFYPLELMLIACVYQNEKGTWNIQFHDHTDTAGFNVNFLVAFDVELPGLTNGEEIRYGVATGDGGGGIANFTMGCAPCQTCNQCWDGLPNSWTVDRPDPTGQVATFPTVIHNWGACATLDLGSLIVDVQTVQIGSNIFGPVYYQTYPYRFPPEPAMVSIRMSLVGTLWFEGGNVTPTDAEKIYVAARVGAVGGMFLDLLGNVVVAVWTCRWEDFCCYGDGGSNTFTRERLFPDGTFFGGEPWNLYFEQYSGWPDELVIKSIGPPSDMPCSQTCVWQAVKGTDLRLRWELFSPHAVNAFVVCKGPNGTAESKCPDQPPFDPTYEGQKAYVQCGE